MSKGNLAVQIIGFVVNTTVYGFRLWIVWRRPQARKTAAKYVAEVLLALAFIINNAQASIEVWRFSREQKIIKQFPGMPVDSHLEDSTFNKVYFGDSFLYPTFLWLVKGTFVAMYADIYQRMRPFIQKVFWATACYILATFLVEFFLHLLWCHPINTAITGDCATDVSLPVNTTTTVLNMTSDLALISLWISIIVTLKLRWQALYASFLVLFTGIATIIIAGVRYAIIFNIIKRSEATIDHLDKFVIVSSIEMRLILVGVCLPAYRVFLRNETERSTKSSRSKWSSRLYGPSSQNTHQGKVGDDTIELTNTNGISVTNEVQLEVESRHSGGASTQSFREL